MKRVSQRSAESRGFSPGLRFLPQGKLTGWVRINMHMVKKVISQLWDKII